MLDRSPTTTLPEQARPNIPPGVVILEQVRHFIRSNFWQLALVTLLGLIASILYALAAQPTFVAKAEVLIETESNSQPTLSLNEAQLTLDTPQVESQLALLRSEQIAERVARRFNFQVEPTSGVRKAPLAPLAEWFDSVWRSVRGPDPMPEYTSDDSAERAKLRTAITKLQANIDVRRVGVSYVLQIAYASPSPRHAASMANAFAEAYVQDRRETRAVAARRGSEWLEKQITALRRQMNVAALDVQEFRARRDYRIVERNRSSAFGAADQSDTGIALADGAGLAGDNATGTAGAGRTAGDASTVADRLAASAAANQGGDREETPSTLEELKSRADTYQKIFESYLQAYTESVQRQSYPVTNARVITAASEPLHKYAPARSLIVAGGLVLGGLFAVALALLRTALDYRVGQANQLREQLGVECLGHIARQEFRSRVPLMRRLIQRFRRLIGRPDDQGNLMLLREVHDIPMSAFSRSIKNVRTAISVTSEDGLPQVLGITSSLPGEGKTTFAGNLAALQTQAGLRVLLIDADLHNPTLTRTLAPDSSIGLLEVLTGKATVADILVPAVEPFPDFLPLQLTSDPGDVGGALNPARLKALISSLREDYEFIVVDLPPLHPVAEALSFASVVDSTAVIAEWEVTPVAALANALSQLRRTNANISGVILSKVLRMHDALYVSSVRSHNY